MPALFLILATAEKLLIIGQLSYSEIPKLTKDQRDAISGTGKYKPTPKPAAPTNVGRSSSTPRFNTLAMPDPMNLMRYKSFESKKKGK